MKARIEINNKNYYVDFNQPIDISLPLTNKHNSTKAWYVDDVAIQPIKNGDFIGSVEKGGSVNFNLITFAPHGNGTHTECVGHISKEKYSIHDCLKQFVFLGQLISVKPINNAITKEQIKDVLNPDCTALVIRTLPNSSSKKQFNYSGKNPAFISEDAMHFLQKTNIKHLLIDTPSVDPEDDNGTLAAHKIFWNYPEKPKLDKTITELVYIPQRIDDGMFLLQLQIISLDNNASPSKPILYKIQN